MDPRAARVCVLLLLACLKLAQTAGQDTTPTHHHKSTDCDSTLDEGALKSLKSRASLNELAKVTLKVDSSAFVLTRTKVRLLSHGVAKSGFSVWRASVQISTHLLEFAVLYSHTHTQS